MLTGAVIATAVQQPWLVVPLAFLSHFVLDTFPHFGIHESDSAERNAHPFFRTVLTVDLVLVFLALVLIPILFSSLVSWWVILLGMLAAYAPDVVWIAHFWHDKKGHDRKEPIWLTKFHQKIQWFEKPPGIATEIIWLGLTISLLAYIAS